MKIDLFGSLPVARHPAWAATWCTYPTPDDVPPARDCLRFKRGEARNPHDCMECEFVRVRAIVAKEARDA